MCLPTRGNCPRGGLGREPAGLEIVEPQLVKALATPTPEVNSWRPFAEADFAFQRAATLTGACRLEQLNKIAGRIHQQDLRAARTGQDVVAKLEAGGAQASNLGRQIVDHEVNAIPATGPGPLAIGHRPARRACWSAEQKPQRSAGDVCEGGSLLGQQRKAQMLRIPLDGSLDVVDHVAHVDTSVGHSTSRSWGLGIKRTSWPYFRENARRLRGLLSLKLSTAGLAGHDDLERPDGVTNRFPTYETRGGHIEVSIDHILEAKMRLNSRILPRPERVSSINETGLSCHLRCLDKLRVSRNQVLGSTQVDRTLR